MKKIKIISLLLSFALIASLVLPGIQVSPSYAVNTRDENGMVVNKTATKNNDGTYTVTLEAYAKGEQVISTNTEDIPADIILVLDQSGSMEDFMSYRYDRYTNKTNEEYFALRHNNVGSSQNLYYPLQNGGYSSVSVTRESAHIYRPYSMYTTNSQYFANYNNLYRWDGREYQNVTIQWYYDYYGRVVYHYSSSDGWWFESIGSNFSPGNFNGGGSLYYYNGVDYRYTYGYTDRNGVYQRIGISDGANTRPTYDLYGRSPTSTVNRLTALKTAVSGFTERVKSKAAGVDGILGTADDVNHRIAVVGFATGEYGPYNDAFENTEVFVGANQYNYNVNATSAYAAAFQQMNTVAGYQNIVASINALAAKGATYPNYGLILANGILNAHPLGTDEKRNRFVILFTDGAPGYSDYDNTVARAAVTQASFLKNDGVTVYSVGIFDGADITAAGSEPGAKNWHANQFMQHVSSNNGTPSDPSFYLSASDPEGLENVFEHISTQIEVGGSSTTLDAEAVVRDVISPYFELPAGTTEADITLETYTYVGEDTWRKNTTAMGATASIDGDKVNVSGFDFSEHWCGKVTSGGVNTYHGNKLVISFKVKLKPGFLGGNKVPTNNFSGVYENNTAQTPVVGFPRPVVDIPIPAVTVQTPDHHVYLFQDVSDEAIRSSTVRIGDVALDLNRAYENYGLELWQNAYVDIAVDIKDKDGNSIDKDFEDLKEDNSYTISVTVTPQELGDSVAMQSGNGTGKIRVYKPELTFKDGETWYGSDILDYEELMRMLTKTTWYHLGRDIDGVEVKTEANEEMGAAPKLIPAFTTDQSLLDNGKINTKEDVPVEVTVSLELDHSTGETVDITGDTTFEHINCPGKVCVLPSGYKAFLHLKTCQLTVNKHGGADAEPYVFTLNKDGAAYSEITIVGNGSETVYELPLGTYSIAEDEKWSWRYQADNGASVILSPDNSSGEITCTNTKNENKTYWLNAYSQVVKNSFHKITEEGGGNP